MENVGTYVFDFGSGISKAGDAGTELPRVVINSVYTPAKVGEKIVYGKAADELCEQNRKRKLVRPVLRGEIKWQGMETFAGHMIEELDPAQNFWALLANSIARKPKDRQQMTKMFFENFGAGGFLIYPGETLSLYSTGRTNGMVVDAGHGTTNIVPIYEGTRLTHGMDVLNFGGQDVDNQLKRTIVDELQIKINAEDVKNIKHKLCSMKVPIMTSSMQESLSYEPKQYELPNGDMIWISEQSQRLPEKFFTECKVHEAVHNCMRRLDDDLRMELYGNIVLTGGSSMTIRFGDMFNHFWKTLEHDFPVKPAVLDSQRFFSSWIGGSMLGSLSTFKDLITRKADYEEMGERAMLLW